MEYPELTPEPKFGAPVREFVRQSLSVVSHLEHKWEYCSAILLSPSEERTIVRDPVSAVPAPVASRLAPARVWAVPYIECLPEEDVVREEKPKGDTHTVVWVEENKILHVVVACRESNAHDAGFELLAAIGEILQERLSRDERSQYRRLLEQELKDGVPGEIDEDVQAVKKKFLAASTREKKDKLDDYLAASFAGTLSEYIHGLWHDVEVRLGPSYLPVPALRRRLELMTHLFPPNEGYQVFAENFAREIPAPPSPGSTGRQRPISKRKKS